MSGTKDLDWLKLRLRAIREVHKQTGFLEDPTTTAEVRFAIAGIKRQRYVSRVLLAAIPNSCQSLDACGTKAILTKSLADFDLTEVDL